MPTYYQLAFTMLTNHSFISIFFFTKKHHVHERYLAPLLVLLYIHNPNKSVGLMFVIEVQAGGVNKTISKELNLILQIVDF